MAYQRDRTGTPADILFALNEVISAFQVKKAHRLDLEAIVASGIFEECAASIEALRAGGKEQLHDVSALAAVVALKLVLHCRTHPSGCESRIRSLGPALEFCIQHDLVVAKEIGSTTATFAALIGGTAPATARHVVHPLPDKCIH